MSVKCQPSEGQKKESEERASAKKQLIPYKLEIKNNLSEPLANITVKVADQVYQSDPNGVIALNTFTLGNYPIEIEHPDYYFTSLTLNISSNKSNEVIELTPKLNNEVSVIFAGDTMFGRRFMDPSITTMGNSVPNLPDAMINLANAATASIEITKAVAPLFIHSDFASVNLESPVLNQPINVHPTKEFSFFSY